MKINVYFVLFIIIVSCVTEPEEEALKSKFDLYTKIKSVNGQSVNINVFISGADGNQITGAIVNAMNPNKSTILLYHSMSDGCYQGTFNSLISGKYTFKIRSTISSLDNVEFNIDHKVINKKVNVLTFSDISGNSVLIGEKIDASSDITCSWDYSENVNVYSVNFYNDNKLVYSQVTEKNFIVILPNSLSPGLSYALKINSQYLSGDPFFQTDDYSSESLFDGSYIYFGTK